MLHDSTWSLPFRTTSQEHASLWALFLWWHVISRWEEQWSTYFPWCSVTPPCGWGEHSCVASYIWLSP
jgi:hypothetical protein